VWAKSERARDAFLFFFKKGLTPSPRDARDTACARARADALS